MWNAPLRIATSPSWTSSGLQSTRIAASAPTAVARAGIASTSGSSYWPRSAVRAYGTAPFSRIQATATVVSSPPENAIPTRSPTGSEVRTRVTGGSVTGGSAGGAALAEAPPAGGTTLWESCAPIGHGYSVTENGVLTRFARRTEPRDVREYHGAGQRSPGCPSTTGRAASTHARRPEEEPSHASDRHPSRRPCPWCRCGRLGLRGRLRDGGDRQAEGVQDSPVRDDGQGGQGRVHRHERWEDQPRDGGDEEQSPARQAAGECESPRARERRGRRGRGYPSGSNQEGNPHLACGEVRPSLQHRRPLRSRPEIGLRYEVGRGGGAERVPGARRSADTLRPCGDTRFGGPPRPPS